jgi:hypothetical protein
MKVKTFKAAYEEYMKERQDSCTHSFVDGYDVAAGEAYKRCGSCGLERNRRKMSEEDAQTYLGIMDNLSAKGDKQRLGERLGVKLEGTNG